MRSDMKEDYLQRIFEYPVPCYGCLDGPGHLISHLLTEHYFMVTQKVTLFGKLPLEGQYMQVTCIIMSTPDADETLAGYFPKVDEYILRELKVEIHEIISSQFLLFVMIWNTLEQAESTVALNLGAIVVGIRKALQLPDDPKVTPVLRPLSLELLRIGNGLSTRRYQRFTERELVKREVTMTSQLLLTNLAVRSIFGRFNSHRISCAQAVGDIPPALGWLPPYDW